MTKTFMGERNERSVKLQQSKNLYEQAEELVNKVNEQCYESERTAFKCLKSFCCG